MATTERTRRWAHEFPIGSRVHHANQLWTAWWSEEQRQANPQWGWGTVLEVETRYADASGCRGDLEVLVRSDAPHWEDGPTDRWWPAWLIDEVRS